MISETFPKSENVSDLPDFVIASQQITKIRDNATIFKRNIYLSVGFIYFRVYISCIKHM